MSLNRCFQCLKFSEIIYFKTKQKEPHNL